MNSNIPKSLLVVALGAMLHTAGVAAQVHDPRAVEADPATATGPIAPRLEGLGVLVHPVTTSSPDSQAFFDQGLRLTYAFNHSEALRSFKEAARLDPNNAMAYWGWALVLGPNLNLPMTLDVAPQAFVAIQKAVALRDGVTAVERAYIDALASRYVAEPLDRRQTLDQRYAMAMQALAIAHPDDPDAVTLYAAALMNLQPWDYWTPDRQAKAGTETILGMLESALRVSPKHPGALHYYIHAVEAAHPDKGVASADALRGLMPGAGHLVHMPSHIYMRVGRYADSYEANALATQADQQYITQCRAQGIYPLNYYPHNLHFMVWSALFQGRSEAALESARIVEARVPKNLAGNVWGLFETFASQPLYVMVRFGMWDAILTEPKPAETSKFMTGVWHYARGLAYLNTDRRKKAEGERKALRNVREGIASSYGVGFATAPVLLSIADEVLAGEIAAERGKFLDAVGHLDRAVRLEDGMLYNEPPDWYFPVRHYLGAALLAAGRPDEAEVVYWHDLGRNRDNGYALYGLTLSLEALGKADQAAAMRRRFEAAWANADVILTSSRF